MRIAFLGCGFITRVHSRHLKALRGVIEPSYASRDGGEGGGVLGSFRRRAQLRRLCGGHRRSEGGRGRHRGAAVAFTCDLTLQALAAGKHVLVEKPAFPTHGGLSGGRSRPETARGASSSIGENDHYKPLAVRLRRLLGDGRRSASSCSRTSRPSPTS